jgi:hypothetical protein
MQNLTPETLRVINQKQQRVDADKKNRSDAINRALFEDRDKARDLTIDLVITRILVIVLLGLNLFQFLYTTNPLPLGH